MSAVVTWAQLSDWHERAATEFDRRVVRDQLLVDLGAREELDEALAEIDFVVFCGDLAFSGMDDEFTAAREHLLDPVLRKLEVEPGRLFAVPGNHDLDRSKFKYLPQPLLTPLPAEGAQPATIEWLTDDVFRSQLLSPFASFSRFMAEYTSQADACYASTRLVDARGCTIRLAGLNSALMCGRDESDYGRLFVGEPQVLEVMNGGAETPDTESDLTIAVMHHPFSWLTQAEQDRVRGAIGRHCHFLLHGHEHKIQVNVVAGTEGSHVVIPSGAAYDRRVPDHERFASAYALVRVDLDTGHGTVYLRTWNDIRSEWTAATDRHPGGEFDFVLTDRAGPSGSPSKRKTPEPPAQEQEAEADWPLIEGYLAALVRESADIEPGGIKQTKQTLVLPLDEVYLSLQASKDRPDVDRRVMREDLEEIRQRFEELESREESELLERQRAIYAEQARIVGLAADTAESAEELPDIVQRRRQVVVLGDPGSGKTTLLRYLALQFARACQENPEAVLGEQAGANVPSTELGPVRFPILLRISHYSEARQRDRDLALMDYLPRYFSGLQVPHAERLGPIFRRLLERGRCIVLLDGLDEIIDPVDRRNIARAIGNFVGAYRGRGVPTSEPVRPSSPRDVARSASGGGRGERGRTEDDVSPERIRRDRERRLEEERYSHLGNHFVITSRIAGYHSAAVPGPFDHFTIRDMDLTQIRMFLEKWCRAVERHIAKDPDPLQVERRARNEIEGIMEALERSPGVRRLAANPLLLRILAIVHRDQAHLPQRRAELYETAAITLLRDWSLAKGAQGAVIDEAQAKQVLGPLAFHIHETRPTMLLTYEETTRFLCRSFAEERGEDADRPSAKIEREVADFLETVRQHSGLFVEKGDGLYGFMHLTFEEYFAARELVRNSRRARELILERLHLPRWREPILLSVGILSENLADDARDLLEALRDAGSEYEGLLHRDLLFVADCIGDSTNVGSAIRRDVARRLLGVWCDPHAGRYRLLRERVRAALQTLSADQRRGPVEIALADLLRSQLDATAIPAALDAVDVIKAQSLEVAAALRPLTEGKGGMRARQLLREVDARARAVGEDAEEEDVQSTGWAAYRDDEDLADLLGVLWTSSLAASLRELVGEEGAVPIDEAAAEVRVAENLESAEALLADLEDPRPADPAWRELVESRAHTLYVATPLGSELEAAAVSIREAVSGTGLPEGGGSLQDAAAALTAAIRNGRRDLRPGAGGGALRRELGAAVIGAARTGRAVAAHLAAVAAERHDVVDRALQGSAADAPTAGLDEVIVRRLRAALLETNDDLAYTEIARFLLESERYMWFRLSDSGDRSDETAQLIVLGHLVDGKRRGRALEVLRGAVSAQIVTPGLLSQEQRAVLDGLVDGPLEEAEAALEILLFDGVDGALLRRCWQALVEDDPLAETYRARLFGTSVPGTKDVLASVDAGLRLEEARPLALELLRNLEWVDEATLPWALRLIDGEDGEARSLAALLLASLPDRYVELRNLLDVAEQAPDERTPWPALADSPRVVRLLAALWARGWDASLAYLWYRAPVSDRYSELYWRYAPDYSRAVRVIPWLLREARALVPEAPAVASVFEEAANTLAMPDDWTREPPDDVAVDEAVAIIERAAERAPELLQYLPPTSVRRLLQSSSAVAALAADDALEASIGDLAALLDDADVERRRGAAIALLARDLDALLLAAFVEAQASDDERIRAAAREALYAISGRLQADENPDLFEGLNQALAEEKTSGPRRTLLASALLGAKHVRPHLVLGWIERDMPLMLGRVSEGVEAALAKLVDHAETNRELRQRALRALVSVRAEGDGGERPVATGTMMRLVDGDDEELSRTAAWGLQWTSDEEALETARALLDAAWDHPDDQTRAWALGSAGRLIGNLRSNGNVDLTPEAAGTWIRDRSYDPDALAERIESAPTAEAVIDVAEALVADSAEQAPADEVRMSRLLSEEWADRLEASKRRRLTEPLVEDLRRFLREGDTRLRRAAACAFARAHADDPDVALALSEVPLEPAAVVTTLLDAGADHSSAASEQALVWAQATAGWIHAQPAALRGELVDQLLDSVEWAFTRAESEGGDNELEDALSGADQDRPVVGIAALAELSERLTPRVFLHARDAPDVIALFARAALDRDSWQTRQWALRTLGNLRTLTADVVKVLEESCGDVQVVYAEARAAVPKFSEFEAGTLARLTAAAGDENTVVAHHAIQLLGSLASHRSEELGSEGRHEIASRLVTLIERPEADRTVLEYGESGAEVIGPMYDVLYEAVARVVDPNLAFPTLMLEPASP